MTDYHGVLLRPVVSEKSLDMAEHEGKFQFRVAITANKIEIRQAVEHVFPKVHVTKVNTLIVRGKRQRRMTRGRRVEGYTSRWKKAIVTLAPGEKLDIFENI
ncbi:MAG TPA: 50S ribosomal protein L23 [Armatimonadota bacterium]|nr:50S ribosomal protein L23 [Armatimonadota bacterium]